MQKQSTQLPEIKLIGLTVRTKNADEMDPQTSKIAPLSGAYWSNDTASLFAHRTNPSRTFAVYTEYESDENAEYTYFIGEEVDSFEGQDLETFSTLTIAPRAYTQFTTESGAMPGVVIDAWQAIWQMDGSDFGAKRSYQADFEIYDHRAADPINAMIDIFIGVES